LSSKLLTIFYFSNIVEIVAIPLLENLNQIENDTCNEMFGSCSYPYAKPLFYGYTGRDKTGKNIDGKREGYDES